MDASTIQWLLEGPEWLQFAVRKQLLDETLDPKPAANSEPIQQLLQTIHNEEQGFPALYKGRISYKQSLYWYLSFLSEIGFSADDLGLQKHFDQVLEVEDQNHKLLLSKEMKPDYFCISSILLTALARMSEDVKEQLHPHIGVIMNAQRLDGGWHCAKRRAAGNKLEDSPSCLMDNLNILMLLAEYEEHRNNQALDGAIDLFLEHWRRQNEPWRPYGFGVGSDFKKLRYPAVNYGILRVLDVLSMYPYAFKQAAFQDMLGFVMQKTEDGRYYPESISKMFNDFDFGQKKEPSKWITFLVNRIEKRIQDR